MAAVLLLSAVFTSVAGILIASAVPFAPLPKADCPLYVHEGGTLRCQCRAPSSAMEGSELTWLGFPDSPVLEKTNVARTDNGTKFYCQMFWSERVYTSVYTLQVAYGPTNETTKIAGPEYFVTNGSMELTLTCSATDSNPPPSYIWQYNACNHGTVSNTCTFIPEPYSNDEDVIECKAVNMNVMKHAVATYVLHLRYPPKEGPRILGHKDHQIHKSGDNLTCIVRGGNPRVSEVIFNCSNPEHPDKNDTIGKGWVSSSMTINSSGVTDVETKCICLAIWTPSPDLYNLNETVFFAVVDNRIVEDKQVVGDSGLTDGLMSEDQRSSKKWIIAFSIVACFLLIAFGIIAFMTLYYRRLKGRRNTPGTPRDAQVPGNFGENHPQPGVETARHEATDQRPLEKLHERQPDRSLDEVNNVSSLEPGQNSELRNLETIQNRQAERQKVRRPPEAPEPWENARADYDRRRQRRPRSSDSLPSWRGRRGGLMVPRMEEGKTGVFEMRTYEPTGQRPPEAPEPGEHTRADYGRRRQLRTRSSDPLQSWRGHYPGEMDPRMEEGKTGVPQLRTYEPTADSGVPPPPGQSTVDGCDDSMMDMNFEYTSLLHLHADYQTDSGVRPPPGKGVLGPSCRLSEEFNRPPEHVQSTDSSLDYKKIYSPAYVGVDKYMNLKS